MSTPLRILHLEDEGKDNEMIERKLRASGLAFEIRRVDSRADFVAGLKSEQIDLILADYVLPEFDGLSALAVAREINPEIPFIFVSGTMGEEVAIETLKEGATDYVLKGRLG